MLVFIIFAPVLINEIYFLGDKAENYVYKAVKKGLNNREL